MKASEILFLKDTWTNDSPERHTSAKGLKDAAVGVLVSCLCTDCEHVPGIRQQTGTLWVTSKSVVNGHNQIFPGKQMDLWFGVCFCFFKQKTSSKLKLDSFYLFLLCSGKWDFGNIEKERLTALHQRTIQFLLCFSSLGNRQIRKLGSRLCPSWSFWSTDMLHSRQRNNLNGNLGNSLFISLDATWSLVLLFYMPLPHRQIYGTTFQDILQTDIFLYQLYLGEIKYTDSKFNERHYN